MCLHLTAVHILMPMLRSLLVVVGIVSLHSSYVILYFDKCLHLMTIHVRMIAISRLVLDSSVAAMRLQFLVEVESMEEVGLNYCSIKVELT